jgi:DNA-directed RNA polymerase specialized sigma24 family protein
MSVETADAVVIERSLSDPGVFGVIFDRHFDAVYGYLARRVGSSRADDLASSTFVVAFERRRDFRAEAGSARPWLFGIATNLLRNEWRAQKRTLALLGRLRPREVPGAVSDPAGVSGVGELVAGLDPGQRDVLLLYAWEDLSYEEIAVVLGIPVGTVRSRLARARASLRSLLDKESDVASDTQEMSG